jgi:ubiquinone/menaquinone biosynthesis C-methylase UbiE
LADLGAPGNSSPPICDYEDSNYRTDFWEGRGRDYEDLAERIALRRLLPSRGRRLLDIGAGFGRLATAYEGYEQVILLDYSRSQLEYARQHLGDQRFLYVAADIYRLPLATDAVDTVVMVRVLHHIADVPLAFAQIARTACAGGTFVLEFANKRHLKNILRYLVRRGVNPFDPQPYQFATLHYDFHPAWVAQQLWQAGFCPQEHLSVSLFRSPFFKRLFAANTLSHLDGALQRITAPLTLGPSIFVRSSVTKPSGPGAAGALFRCPTCGHEDLQRDADGLRCATCNSLWPIINGVHVFR